MNTKLRHKYSGTMNNYNAKHYSQNNHKQLH